MNSADASSDARWMAAAIALGERGRGRTAPNPNVGCVIVKDDIVVGRGWTQPGGRPHAEAVALAEARGAARDAAVYTGLEPCAHVSDRGPACADALISAGVARVFVALQDPDPRTAGEGIARLRGAGIAVAIGEGADEAAQSMAGFLCRQRLGRPFVTLKLAMSIDARIAMADGASRWITGEEARRHAHVERARADAILVGRGTFDTDSPYLDVRIEGLEDRSPRRLTLTSGEAPPGWFAIASPEAIRGLLDVNDLIVEGGTQTASAFLAADLIDRLCIYTAPIVIGSAGKAAIGDIGLDALSDAHDRWRRFDSRVLGSDRLDVYERVRE